MTAMNWADYVILGVILLSVLIGLWRGLVSEVMALAIWIAAFWVAWVFGPAVAAQFRGVIELPSARVLVGYGLCFLVVLLAGALLRFVVSRLVESTGLSGTDRLLGMGFGFVRGVLLVTVAVFLLGFTPFSRDPWWRQSVLMGQAQVAADWMAQRLPDSVRRYVHPRSHTVSAPNLHLPAGLPRAISDRLSGRGAHSTTPASAASVVHRMRPSADIGRPDANPPQE